MAYKKKKSQSRSPRKNTKKPKVSQYQKDLKLAKKFHAFLMSGTNDDEE